MFSIPNLLTASNLFCGCLAILKVAQNEPKQALLLVSLSLVFDFFDGFVARWLKQESAIGIQLDSLADVVSFGILPAFMLHTLLFGHSYKLDYLVFLLSVAAAFRLARFNVETDGSVKNFKGMPVPAMAILICGIYASFHLDQHSIDFLFHPVFILGLILVLSFLMLSRINFLKIVITKSFFQQHWILLIMYIGCMVFLFSGYHIALSLLIIVHLLYSFFQNYFIKKV